MGEKTWVLSERDVDRICREHQDEIDGALEAVEAANPQDDPTGFGRQARRAVIATMFTKRGRDRMRELGFKDVKTAALVVLGPKARA